MRFKGGVQLTRRRPRHAPVRPPPSSAVSPSWHALAASVEPIWRAGWAQTPWGEEGGPQTRTATRHPGSVLGEKAISVWSGKRMVEPFRAGKVAGRWGGGMSITVGNHDASSRAVQSQGFAGVATARCERCGAEFDPGWLRPGRNRLYCDACPYEVRRRMPAIERRACEVCGKVYQPARTGQRWCSKGCKNRRPRARMKAKPCQWCGELFEPSPSYGLRFCGRRCAAQSRAAAGRLAVGGVG
jgi:hypothetical protein